MTYSETIRHHGNPFTVWTNPEINRTEIFVSNRDRRDFIILPVWGPMDRSTRFYHSSEGGAIYFGQRIIAPGRRD